MYGDGPGRWRDRLLRYRTEGFFKTPASHAYELSGTYLSPANSTVQFKYMRMSIRLIIIAVLIGLSGCVEVVGTHKTQKSTSAGDYALERRVVELVNKARAKARKCGASSYRAAPPLAWNNALGQAALTHSMDMALNGFLSHTGSDGSTPGTRASKAGFKWKTIGEDVGQGYRTPEDAVQGWLRSEAHCKNIMSPEFREAGAARARSDTLRTYWAVAFGASWR